MKVRGSIVRDVAFGALLALDNVCRLVPRKPGRQAVVIRVDAIGDHFLWLRTGAVNVSRYARAEAGRVVLVTSPAVAPYARRSGLWDDVLELNEVRFQVNPVYRVRALYRIRRLEAGLLIQPRPSRALWMEDAIARVCGIPRRIASTGTLLRATESQRKRGNRYYEQIIPIDGSPRTHESFRNVQFAKGLTDDPPMPFQFQQPAGDGTRAGLLVALGAGTRTRVWPIAKLAMLIAHVARLRPSIRILVAGTKADAADVQRLRELSGVHFESRVGGTSLSEFIQLVATSEVIVCNDSAAFHIARAFGRKVLCLLGGGHPGAFVPYPPSFDAETSGSARVVAIQMSCFGCDWRCVHALSASGAYKCIDQIPTAPAIAALDELLA